MQIGTSAAAGETFLTIPGTLGGQFSGAVFAETKDATSSGSVYGKRKIRLFFSASQYTSHIYFFTASGHRYLVHVYSESGQSQSNSDGFDLTWHQAPCTGITVDHIKGGT